MRSPPGASSVAGMNCAAAKPITKGTATPAAEMEKQARPTLRTSLRSVSMPVSKSSISTPSWATALIMLFWLASPEKTTRSPSGHSQPSSEGPSRMPAMSWPITAGWPKRSSSSPRPRPTRSKRMISRTKTPSLDMPVFSAPQAMAGVTNSVIAAIATDRCLFGRKDKTRTPRLLRTTTVWRAYRLHRRVARKRLAATRTIRFKCGCGCLLSGKATQASSRHGGQ